MDYFYVYLINKRLIIASFVLVGNEEREKETLHSAVIH